jgi:alpha-D-ribose 1-methylphosphonate 5-triphosphate synthase subunit PhnH
VCVCARACVCLCLKCVHSRTNIYFEKQINQSTVGEILRFFHAVMQT